MPPECATLTPITDIASGFNYPITLHDPKLTLKAHQKGGLLYQRWKEDYDLETDNGGNDIPAMGNTMAGWMCSYTNYSNQIDKSWSLFNQNLVRTFEIENSLDLTPWLVNPDTNNSRAFYANDVDLNKVISLLSIALTLPSFSEKIGDGVLDFCQKEGVIQDLYQYLSIIKFSFVNVNQLNVTLESDPEIENSFNIVFEIVAESKIEDLLRMQNTFYQYIVDFIPLQNLKHFVIKCERYES